METQSTHLPSLRIRYCPRCGWLLRSAWMAQELLSTFGDELAEVALAPAGPGEFRIESGDVLIWERSRDGGFPDINELKRRVRDHVSPGRDLGHVDQRPGTDRRQK